MAVVSTCQAWAVGDYLNTKGPGHTLAEHWNGTAWNQVLLTQRIDALVEGRCALGRIGGRLGGR